MPEREERGVLKRLRESDHPLLALLRELLVVIAIVGAIALGLFLFSGTWPALVTVESESMVPHMNVGDLVLVVEEDRFGRLVTWEEGNETGYRNFGDYGDVIIYLPNGRGDVHPIIHRALKWMDEEEVAAEFPWHPLHAGYLTKGDHNPYPDQYGRIGNAPIEPVKREWVVGKALVAIPLLGYPALYLPQFAAIVIVILILHELIAGRRAEAGRGQKSGKKERR